MSQATTDIDKRRREQDRQHGGQAHDDRHTPVEWITLLNKFTGRAAAATPLLTGNPRVYREALVDLAAVAQAAIESLDRKGGF
jgi:hypothetical protein